MEDRSALHRDQHYVARRLPVQGAAVTALPTTWSSRARSTPSSSVHGGHAASCSCRRARTPARLLERRRSRRVAGRRAHALVRRGRRRERMVLHRDGGRRRGDVRRSRRSVGSGRARCGRRGQDDPDVRRPGVRDRGCSLTRRSRAFARTRGRRAPRAAGAGLERRRAHRRPGQRPCSSSRSRSRSSAARGHAEPLVGYAEPNVNRVAFSRKFVHVSTRRAQGAVTPDSMYESVVASSKGTPWCGGGRTSLTLRDTPPHAMPRGPPAPGSR